VIRRLVQKGKELLKKSREGSDSETQSPPLLPTPPAYIYIIINKVCNLRCKMCDIGQHNKESQFYQVMAREGRELNIDILKRLVDEVQSFRPTLAITSTEPLLYNDLFLFVRYAKEAELPVQITTNGLLLPRYAEEMVESGVDSLWISLDGPQEAHNLIRGNPSSYQQAVDGIGKVVEARKRHADKISININYSISNHNYSCMVEFLKGIVDLPLDSISFSHMNYVTEEMAALHNRLYGSYCSATPSSVTAADPLKVEINALDEQIKEIKKGNWPFSISFSPDITEERLENFYRRPEIVIASKTCAASFNMAQLASNGDWVITTRCFSLSMGNLFEEPFMSTWNGKEYNMFRSWISGIGLSPACTRCCGAL